jgi:hypothetical protein
MAGSDFFLLTPQKVALLLEQTREPYERRVLFLSLLGLEMSRRGARSLPCLVGGGAVELYTRGNYATTDLDLLVLDQQTFRDVLEDWGFLPVAQGSRVLYGESMDILVENLGGTFPEVGDGLARAPLRRIEVRLLDDEGSDAEGTVAAFEVLHPEDLILDRLLSAKHWASSPLDSEEMQWATALLVIGMEGAIRPFDYGYLQERAIREGLTELLDQAIGRAGAIAGRDQRVSDDEGGVKR